MEKKEKEVFRRNYASFCDILKHEDSLHTHLVGKNIISPDELENIRSKSVAEKGPTLLRHISGPLDAGHTDGFYGLLEIMREYGKPDTQEFSKNIKHKCQSNRKGMYVCIIYACIVIIRLSKVQHFKKIGIWEIQRGYSGGSLKQGVWGTALRNLKLAIHRVFYIHNAQIISTAKTL